MDEYSDDHDIGPFLVRGVVGADTERAGLIVGAEVAVGQTVRFQVRDAESADADLAATLARFRDEGPPGDSVDGALLFSCSGRGADLFASAHHDVLAVREGLATTVVAGFFAAGEIGPVVGRTRLQGSTASMLAFS